MDHLQNKRFNLGEEYYQEVLFPKLQKYSITSIQNFQCQKSKGQSYSPISNKLVDPTTSLEGILGNIETIK